MTKNFSTGFTILETIISIAVVSLAIAGAATAVRVGIVGASSAKDQTRAFYLTQEAIEIIRNKRDGNELSNLSNGSTDWLTGIALPGNPCAPDNICTVDATNYTLSNSGCGSEWNTCPYLRQDLNSSSASYLLYGYNGSWTQTPYRREVQIQSISSTEVSITVQITWLRGTTLKSFKTTTIMKDWF